MSQPSAGRQPSRIDYYDDPAAPQATTIVPSVNVVVVNEAGQILLIRRADNGNWALPGGAIEIGESLTEAAVREVLEETGVTCRITGMVGIYSDPRHVIHYTSNDEVRQEFSILLSAAAVSGDPTVNIEVTEVAWFNPEHFKELPAHSSMRRRIDDWLTPTEKPTIR